MRVLSDADVATVLDLEALLAVIDRAFRKQGRGEVQRPDRPKFPVGAGLDPDAPTEPLGTGLTMPAYVHGDDHYATKLVSVHPGNAERGLPTVSAEIVLTDAATGQPAAFLAGTRITNARTGCIGGLAARELALRDPRPPGTDRDGHLLGVLGAGQQARWQTRAIATATDVAAVRVYSPSDSRRTCAAELSAELDVETTAVTTPEEAVKDATIVVTATTSERPVFPGNALAPGALVVAVGAYTAEMCELDAQTVERAGRVFADVPAEAIEVGDLRGRIDATDLHPLASVLEGERGRASDEEILLVESVGSAVLDAAAAGHVFECATEAGVGTPVDL